eukprot:4172645-Amphidinium_carterae.2
MRGSCARILSFAGLVMLDNAGLNSKSGCKPCEPFRNKRTLALQPGPVQAGKAYVSRPGPLYCQ